MVGVSLHAQHAYVGRQSQLLQGCIDYALCTDDSAQQASLQLSSPELLPQLNIGVQVLLLHKCGCTHANTPMHCVVFESRASDDHRTIASIY
jgi:hypothetical protein